jgi:replicative DNA helicase
MSRIERVILGAILLDSRVYKQAAELQIVDFSLDSHRRIFARMVDLDASGRPLDIVTLIEELESHNELVAVGGEGYIAGLVDGVPDRPSIFSALY